VDRIGSPDGPLARLMEYGKQQNVRRVKARIRVVLYIGRDGCRPEAPREEARVLGEEARRRLSGHGFSTEGREERRMSRSEFPRWGNERADEPKPEPRRGEPTGLVPRGPGAGFGIHPAQRRQPPLPS